jgi:cell cycle sensor histidine kinase DivJ
MSLRAVSDSMRHLTETVRHTLDGHIMKPTIEDADTIERHYRFLVRQLVLGVIGLSAFPIWLAVGAPGSFFASLTFLWLMAPLLVAAYVLRTGQLETGRQLATVTLTGLVVSISAMSGGLASPLLLMFAVIPIAAAADGPGRPVRASLFAAIAGIGLSAVLDITGAATPAANMAFSLIGFAGALLVVGAVALWLKRQNSGKSQTETSDRQPFFHPASTYNQEASAAARGVTAPSAAVESAAHARSEGHLLVLGRTRRLIEPVGVNRRFEEATAREVRDSA